MVWVASLEQWGWKNRGWGCPSWVSGGTHGSVAWGRGKAEGDVTPRVPPPHGNGVLRVHSEAQAPRPHFWGSLTSCSPRSQPRSAPRLQEDGEQNATSLCDFAPAEVPDPKSRAMSKCVGFSACAQGVCVGHSVHPLLGGCMWAVWECCPVPTAHPAPFQGCAGIPPPPKKKKIGVSTALGNACVGARLCLLPAWYCWGAAGGQCESPGAKCHQTATMGCQKTAGSLWVSCGSPGAPPPLVGSDQSPGTVGRRHWGLREVLAVLVVPRAGPPRAAGGSWERGWTRCTSSCGAEAVQSMGASIPKAQHVASRRMGRGKQSRGSEDGPDLERGRCWLRMQGDPVRSESAMRARGRDGGPFLPRGAAVGRALPVPGSPGSPPPPATTPGRRLAPFPPLSSFPAAPGMTHFRGGGRQPAHSRALAPAAPRARSPTGSAAHPGGRRADARSSRPSRGWQRLERCGGRTPHRPPPRPSLRGRLRAHDGIFQ